uniref:Uncharacterized protein n=1 Tax=Triticum urartu TaxID=4572 RepID=A0A8R7UFC6_TRIUA
MHQGRLAPGASVRRVYARRRDILLLDGAFAYFFVVDGEDEDHAKGTSVAVAVVAAIRCAEHGGGCAATLECCGHRYALLGTCDWLPHEEFLGVRALGVGQEEGAAVAAVDGLPEPAVGNGEGEWRCGGGDEIGHVLVVVEIPEHRGCAVEIVEEAAEPTAGDDLAPGLADEGGTEEAGRVVGRDADEDLFYKLVRECWRRSWCHGGR